MKSTIQRVLLAVAVATLGAGAVGTASAQSPSSAPDASPPHRMHRGPFRHFGGSPFVSSLLRATRQLGKTPQTQQLALSSTQQASIRQILAAARPHHQPGTQPQGPGITQRPDITVLGDPGSQGYAAAVQAAEAAASARIQKQTLVAQQIWGVLSPGQQTAVPAILASIQAKEQARRAQWAARHAAANG